jgi:uncharacterized protein YyaL (SSP411 family)
MTAGTTTHSVRERGLDWLVRSGIRQPNSGPAPGGVKEGYNWRERRCSFVYSEITGYAVSLFVHVYRWTNDPAYLQMARQSARFLIGLQEEVTDPAAVGGIPHGRSLPEYNVLPRFYSFDVAMCLQGLMDLYAVEPDAGLLAAAQATGDWLIGRMARDDGSYRAFYDAATGEWDHPGLLFFDDGGCLHAKHAIGLLKLGAQTGQARYTEAARRVCDWVMGLQDADGAFRANERVAEIFSHPHCYACEGLLYAGFVLGDDRYLDAVRRAGKWLLDVHRADGGIALAYKRSLPLRQRVRTLLQPPHTTDATSQAIRIWLSLYDLDRDERYLAATRRAAAFLGTMQCMSPDDPNADGGFYYYRGYPMLYAWCAMFAVMALKSVERAEQGGIGFAELMREMF